MEKLRAVCLGERVQNSAESENSGSGEWKLWKLGKSENSKSGSESRMLNFRSGGKE